MTGEAVGTAMSRVDGRLKVTGGATYAAEHVIPGLVHGVIVSSTVGRGTITAIDTSKALALSGVLRVLTDFTGVRLAFNPRQVNFFGQPVAIVVATSLEQAEHGASLVEVSYAALPGLTDIDSPAAVPQPAPGNPDYSRGDADAALHEAHTVVDNNFTILRENHNPMELGSTIARWDGGKLTLWDKTQWVLGTQREVAAALGVAVEDVRVISPFVGGAFGNQGRTWEHQLLAAFTAREVGRPVKIVLTRKQMYTGTGYRPTSRQRVAIGADADGRISAIVHEARTETARYAQYAESITELSTFMYGGPNARTQYRLVPVDVNLPTFMRGPGLSTGAFALESSVDQLAHELGIDPIELRLRNEPAVDESNNLPFSSRRLADCYRAGAERFGWSQRRAVPRSREEGDLLIGMGMAAGAYHAFGSGTDVLARIHDDGTAEVFTATSDSGPGTYTSVTQVAADALGLPVSRVRFTLGDSALPRAPMHAGSQTMVSVGSGMFTACNALRDGFVRMAVVDPASPLYGVKPADVSVEGGRLFVTADPGRGETYQQILRRRGRPSMDTTQVWEPGDVGKRFSSYSYGAVFAEVSVDESLGLVRIRRMFAAYDAGRVVSPKLAHSQALSGMVQGIGMSLLESTVLDHRDGRVINANLADYLVPVNADVPELDAVFVNGEDMALDPIGVKGLGEVVMVGVPAAIANAVFNATGRRPLDLPITLDKML
ncbi:xanthine dehydrogenase family protein molybdopterin-binding subunit [Saccharopolyspora sp. 5N708]|uniref:xanthine dehydrogenase family protein molybdopterin-binding subunit n=1 Tax=Saccharopolyspora sp. 5N708 TaxID=3457424 RepID=UPI003FD1A94E